MCKFFMNSSYAAINVMRNKNAADGAGAGKGAWRMRRHGMEAAEFIHL